MTKEIKDESDRIDGNTGNTLFTLGNCLVILYTVGMGVIVAAVLITAKELETSLEEKKDILDNLLEKHTELKQNHQSSLTQAKNTEFKLEENISEMAANIEEIGVKLRKSEDELEVCKKNYDNHMTILQKELTDIKTQMFDREFQVKDSNSKNSELTGLLTNLQMESEEIKSQNDKLSAATTELTSTVTGLSQEKNDLNSEIQKLKFALKQKEESLESKQASYIKEIENLKESHLAQVDLLKASQMQSLENLENQINVRQKEIISKEGQILVLEKKVSEQDNLVGENKRKLAKSEQSLNENMKMNEDLQQAVAVKQDELIEKENEIKLLKWEDSEKETVVKKTGQKLNELTNILAEQEALNKVIAVERNNLKHKIEELDLELEKTRIDAGECLMKKNEGEMLSREQINSLRLEKENAEQKLKDFDLKLSECKTK